MLNRVQIKRVYQRGKKKRREGNTREVVSNEEAVICEVVCRRRLARCKSHRSMSSHISVELANLMLGGV